MTTILDRREIKNPTRLEYNSTSGRRKIATEGHCRMCQRPAAWQKIDGRWTGEDGSRPLTRHHLIPRSYFYGEGQRWRAFRNANANIIPLCRPCHDLVDGKKDLTRAEARRLLRRTLHQREIAFAIKVCGQRWFDLNYPK